MTNCNLSFLPISSKRSRFIQASYWSLACLKTRESSCTVVTFDSSISLSCSSKLSSIKANWERVVLSSGMRTFKFWNKFTVHILHTLWRYWILWFGSFLMAYIFYQGTKIVICLILPLSRIFSLIYNYLHCDLAHSNHRIKSLKIHSNQD